MLVLSRRLGEEIVIAGDIRVTVVAMRGNQVRLGITAPASVPVARAELLGQRAERPVRFPQEKVGQNLVGSRASATLG
jgi:carbon storage regulator